MDIASITDLTHQWKNIIADAIEAHGQVKKEKNGKLAVITKR